ncbi:ComEC/Rec2 family competence protein [Lentibacter sp.]|uniref:ComEC/Rec2 family competence protein n=1 Tax=Lentibacter sp. TaxID=2024994 RepID=UPI003F6D9DDB
MALKAAFEQVLLGQRGALYPWAPVCLALGVGAYFSLSAEPALWVFGLCLAIFLACLGLIRVWRSVFTSLVWAVALVALGFCVAGGKAYWVSGAVLQWHYYGPVEGRVVLIDRSASGAVRLTLDTVVLENMPPNKTPTRVRVALHGPEARPKAGSTVLITAHLSAPSGPVEPGGFDFQRHAWFLQLGAVGYSRMPLMLLEPAGQGALISQARYAFSAFVSEQIGGQRGAFAATIMAGDRSGLSQATMDAMRHTNLAHLLAISGLHMGLLTGFIYAALRYGLLMVPALRHRIAIRKVAAVGALIVSFFYLLLSGGSVATERAFVMAMVALGAVFFERRVFSLRSVATAALIVLLWQPEALLGPGFQMSFAATTALVAVFAALRAHEVTLGPKWLRPFVALFITSLVAGLATAPIAAAHFNHIAHYGLIANLLAVPLMGAVVIPAGVVALLLWPLGLSWLGFYVMELGIAWILGVATYFAGLEGARGTILAPDSGVLALMAAGALGLALWQGRARAVGLLPMVAAAVMWSQTTRPDVLIADTGKLVGVMTPTGRALSADKGSGFVARGWLENDGDMRAQEAAAEGWAAASKRAAHPLLHARRKAEVDTADCTAGQILVVAGTLTRDVPCLVFDLVALKHSGAVAIYFEDGNAKIKTAREVTGRRLWTVAAERRAPRQ